MNNFKVSFIILALGFVLTGCSKLDYSNESRSFVDGLGEQNHFVVYRVLSSDVNIDFAMINSNSGDFHCILKKSSNSPEVVFGAKLKFELTEDERSDLWCADKNIFMTHHHIMEHLRIVAIE